MALLRDLAMHPLPRRRTTHRPPGRSTQSVPHTVVQHGSWRTHLSSTHPRRRTTTYLSPGCGTQSITHTVMSSATPARSRAVCMAMLVAWPVVMRRTCARARVRAGGCASGREARRAAVATPSECVGKNVCVGVRVGVGEWRATGQRGSRAMCHVQGSAGGYAPDLQGGRSVASYPLGSGHHSSACTHAPTGARQHVPCCLCSTCGPRFATSPNPTSRTLITRATQPCASTHQGPPHTHSPFGSRSWPAPRPTGRPRR